MNEPAIAWAPQPGSQELFLSCPVFEVLYEGTRGPGKTDALLMDFAQDVGQGYGPDWRGIIFRPEFDDLNDIVVKSKKWFPRIFPGCYFLASPTRYCWRFPEGEELLFRWAKRPDDYWSYHGQEFPFVGWEELTNWLNLGLYMDMMSICRSSNPKVPRKYRATANPWGRGHNAVKARFIDPAPRGTIITETFKGPKGEILNRQRVAIHGNIYENKILNAADPGYLATLEAIQEPNKRRAWLFGDWDITAGGAIDDLWNERLHVVRPFKIPASWYIDRSFDWGSEKPFSVGFWAESDGCEVTLADGRKRTFPRGTLFRIGEWYGWGKTQNVGLRLEDIDIGRGIAEREKALKAFLGITREFSPGPADSSIFDTDPGKESIAQGIDKGYGRRGCFVKADKSPGSRVNRLAVMRRYLKAALKDRMEDPGLFIFDTCRDGFIRTVPPLPRDERNPEDVDTKAEDHAYDEAGYRLTAPKRIARTIQVEGR